jgi:two-component system chemotaxis sensor kinase CheA
LQNTVASVRLIPIERLLSRFTPVIRNLARERGKFVKYVIEGGDTPLDRAVSEQMYDPLIHMLRNAIDHGLESPDVRRRAGKPDEGTLRISAQRLGDDVVLRVADDGHGIDPNRIRAVAVDRGLYSNEEAAGLTDDEAIRLIFTPGFSTNAAVTDISGRGVGMDVVLENVRRLRGAIDIETELGHGTTFVIKLPLTLAILQVLLVRIGSNVYAVPLHTVRETLRLQPEAIHFLHRGAVTYVHDNPLPLRRLSDWLLPSAASHALVEQQPALVVGLARGDEVVLVDELVGKQQMVIKPLNPYLGQVGGVEGAAILPDGTVGLVLDLERLLT